MGSDEARLEELLKSMTSETTVSDTAVVSGLDALKALQQGNEPEIFSMSELSNDADILSMPELSSDADMFSMPELSSDADMFDISDMPNLSEMLDALDLPESQENIDVPTEEAFSFGNLDGELHDLMMPSADADEEIEIDFSGEANMEEERASLGNAALEEDISMFEDFSASGSGDDLDLASLFGGGSSGDLADIQELLAKSDNHEPVEESHQEEMENLFDLFAEGHAESDVQPEEDSADEVTEEEKPVKKKKLFGKRKEKKAKKDKNEEIVEIELPESEESFGDIDIFEMERQEMAQHEHNTKKEKRRGKKSGFFKKMGESLFGEDDDQEDKVREFGLSDENAAVLEQLTEEDDAKTDKKKGKKEKKKKDKKGKKNKGAVRDGDSTDNVEDEESASQDDKKKKKKKEKKPKREKKVKEPKYEEEKPTKKISKKKIRAVALVCFTLLAIILLLKIVGMNILEMTEARDAYFVGDYKTAYELFKGDKLKDSDKILFEEAAVIVRLQHATETYTNHKKMGKTLDALDDLMQGISYYLTLGQSDNAEYITSDAMEEYHKILELLNQDFGLTQEDAKTILSEEDAYIYNLQLQDLANGKPYIRPGEEEEPEEKIVLDDMLPEEEEYLNGSNN